MAAIADMKRWVRGGFFKMAESLFGVETEYAIAGVAPGGAMDREQILQRLMMLAGRQLLHLPDLNSPGGFFLQNGSRFYVDCGAHPEICTPECANPWDAVRYVQAGHRILASLASAVESASAKGTEIMAFRCNVDDSGRSVGYLVGVASRDGPALAEGGLEPGQRLGRRPGPDPFIGVDGDRVAASLRDRDGSNLCLHPAFLNRVGGLLVRGRGKGVLALARDDVVVVLVRRQTHRCVVERASKGIEQHGIHEDAVSVAVPGPGVQKEVRGSGH